MGSGKFATAVNCMDGRTQLPVIEYVKRRFLVDYVDSVTEAGADGILSSSNPLSESIRGRVSISVGKHASKAIAVVSHFDCAGNPVDEETHKRNLRDAVKIVSEWFPKVKVVGLWVGGDWKVQEVCWGDSYRKL